MNLQHLIVACALGLCTLVGLVGAFVGLGISSMWVDELITAWVIGTDRNAAAVLDRAVQDLNPPLYYLSLFAYSLQWGASDIALRSFSVVAAISAIVVFVLGCHGTFSVNGRLFAATLATASNFWFIQSQNARFYALTLLLGAAILALSLSLLRRKQRPAQRPVTLIALLVLILFGAFTHFYMGYVGLAVLLSLALIRPDFRLVLGSAALLLVTAMAVYLKFVVEPLGQWLTGTSWMRGDLNWYLAGLTLARRSSLDLFGLAAIAVCVALIFISKGSDSAIARTRAYARAVRQQPRRAVDAADPALLLLLGVPAIVFGGAVVSSALLAPNFSDRNFLIVSPFLWGLAAKAYDEAFLRGSSRLTQVASALLIAFLMPMTFVVQARAFPRNMPFRDAGDWIANFPACRGETIPILLDDPPGAAPATKPGFLEKIIPPSRERYLPEMKGVLVRASEEQPAGIRQLWGERLAKGACPVIAWSVDPATPTRANEVAAIIAGTMGVGAVGRIRVQFFAEPQFRRYGQPHIRSEGLYVVYVEGVGSK